MSFFSNLFGGNKHDAPTEGLRYNNGPNPPASAIDPAQTKQNIFPVIRVQHDPVLLIASKNNNGIITRTLAEGIVIAYVMGPGRQQVYVSTNNAGKLDLDKETLHDLAIANLIERTRNSSSLEQMDFSDMNPGSKPFYRVNAPFSLAPSLMLSAPFLQTICEKLGSGHIAMAIPARDTMLLTDFHDKESLASMRSVAASHFEDTKQNNAELSPNIYTYFSDLVQIVVLPNIDIPT